MSEKDEAKTRHDLVVKCDALVMNIYYNVHRARTHTDKYSLVAIFVVSFRDERARMDTMKFGKIHSIFRCIQIELKPISTAEEKMHASTHNFPNRIFPCTKCSIACDIAVALKLANGNFGKVNQAFP